MALECRHFGQCGGCTLQELSPEAYRERKRAGIARALTQYDLTALLEDTIAVPPYSRRRAVFKAKKINEAVAIGFHAAASHAIVDMHACCILTPPLFALVDGLRGLMNELLQEGGSGEIHATETDTGFDIALRWNRSFTPNLVQTVSSRLSTLGIARFFANGEPVAMTGIPSVEIAGCDVKIPVESFLQPTKDGEQSIQRIAIEALSGARMIADLFAGCGTIALTLARRATVHAVETDRAMLNALSDAAKRSTGLKPVSVERRDLFKLPLGTRELARFDGVSLDPPRAGAFAQCGQLARSTVRRIAYTSCSPESFARDARALVDGGFRLRSVTPIDQFLLSDHIELVGIFDRRSGR